MQTITIKNHGPLIVETNYWYSEYERAGKIYCSVNAGAVRLLLPRAQFAAVGEMRTAKYVILSRGPWPEMRIAEAVELLFEDDSDSPYCLHLSGTSFDMIPGEPEPGQEWIVSVWVEKDGQPKKALERPCKWRRVGKIPCLAKWGKK